MEVRPTGHKSPCAYLPQTANWNNSRRSIAAAAGSRFLFLFFLFHSGRNGADSLSLHPFVVDWLWEQIDKQSGPWCAGFCAARRMEVGRVTAARTSTHREERLSVSFSPLAASSERRPTHRRTHPDPADAAADAAIPNCPTWSPKAEISRAISQAKTRKHSEVLELNWSSIFYMQNTEIMFYSKWYEFRLNWNNYIFINFEVSLALLVVFFLVGVYSENGSSGKTLFMLCLL